MASQEDWMLGFDFAQLAMFALVTDGVTTWLRLAPQQAVSEVTLLFLCVFLMFIVVLALALGVRFFGWRTLPRKTEPELRWGAVILADGVGVLYLVIAVELFRRVPRP